MRFRRRARGGELLDRELLVATIDSDLEFGKQVLSSELEVGVRWTTTTDGRPFLPVFSGEARLVEWFPEGSCWLGLKGRDMLELFLSGAWEAMVVDPTQPNPIEVSREEAKRLLGKID